MFPMSTQEVVRAQQSYRLEGFRRWSRRHAVDAPYAEARVPQVTGQTTDGQARHRRPAVRSVLSR